jgi:signal transduction histidine kinase
MKWRLWSRLRARVILTYLVIFLVAVGIVAWRAGNLYAAAALQTAEHDLELQAFVTASVLERPWTLREGEGMLAAPQLQILTGRFAQGGAGELDILDPTGAPIAYSQASPPSNQRYQPEVAAALDGDVQHAVRYDATSRQMEIYAAAPVMRNSSVIGVVQISAPLAQVTSKTQQFWGSLFLTALLAALAAALAGWLLADQLVQPVARLRRAAARLAQGNFDERVLAKDSGGVAEIAELASAFNHMAGQIEEMIMGQRVFVANASHELRTPLTNIKLRAEALDNGALEDPTVARRFVAEIESEANRLSRMASDMLALTRQDAAAADEAEAAKAAHTAVDMAALAADICDEMRLRAEKSGVTLTEQMDPELPPVCADEAGLQTVLLNLVDNALQYTPSGGSVTIGGHVDAGGQTVAVEVRDTGAGIAPEDLPHVFERFYRADKARSRRMAQTRTNGSALAGSGAGLGLAIVQSIVVQHGGKVSVESTLGQGTVFCVTLPVKHEQEAPQKAPQPA